MIPEDKQYWAAWKASSGKYSMTLMQTLWRVTRIRDNGLEELRGKIGRVRLFRSADAAEQAAKKTGEPYINRGCLYIPD